MTGKLVPQDFVENRRSEPRMPAARRIEILPCRAGTKWEFIPGELTDCSLHGLGVLLPEPMDVGQQFLAKLQTPGRVRLLIYTVHNCTESGRSRYRIGARFSGFAAQEFDEDLRVVLDALVKGG